MPFLPMEYIRPSVHAYTKHFLEYQYHHCDGKPFIKIDAVITLKNTSHQHTLSFTQLLISQVLFQFYSFFTKSIVLQTR